LQLLSETLTQSITASIACTWYASCHKNTAADKS